MVGTRFEGKSFISAGEGRRAEVSITGSHMGDGAAFGKKGNVEIVKSDIAVNDAE